MLNEKEAIEIAKNYVKEKYNKEYLLLGAVEVPAKHRSYRGEKNTQWSVMFKYIDGWDPDHIIVDVDTETGKAQIFPTL
jgi:hypothetical protein